MLKLRSSDGSSFEFDKDGLINKIYNEVKNKSSDNSIVESEIKKKTKKEYAWFAYGYSDDVEEVYSYSNILSIIRFGSEYFKEFLIIIPERIEIINIYAELGLTFYVDIYGTIDEDDVKFDSIYDDVKLSDLQFKIKNLKIKTKEKYNKVKKIIIENNFSNVGIFTMKGIEKEFNETYEFHRIHNEEDEFEIKSFHPEIHHTHFKGMYKSLNYFFYTSLKLSKNLRDYLDKTLNIKLYDITKILFEDIKDEALKTFWLFIEQDSILDWIEFFENLDKEIKTRKAEIKFNFQNDHDNFIKYYLDDKKLINSIKKINNLYNRYRWYKQYAIEEAILIIQMNLLLDHPIKIGPGKERNFDNFTKEAISNNEILSHFSERHNFYLLSQIYSIITSATLYNFHTGFSTDFGLLKSWLHPPFGVKTDYGFVYLRNSKN